MLCFILPKLCWGSNATCALVLIVCLDLCVWILLYTVTVVEQYPSMNSSTKVRNTIGVAILGEFLILLILHYIYHHYHYNIYNMFVRHSLKNCSNSGLLYWFWPAMSPLFLSILSLSFVVMPKDYTRETWVEKSEINRERITAVSHVYDTVDHTSGS